MLRVVGGQQPVERGSSMVSQVASRQATQAPAGAMRPGPQLRVEQGGKPQRLDLSVPPVRDALQRLLDHPEALEVSLEKPRQAGDLVGVGFRRRSTGKCLFAYGATLQEAAERALAEVSRKQPPVAGPA